MSIDKEYLLQESKVFCMLPWVHVHMSTNGHFRPCCVSNVHKPYGHSKDMTITEAFDSDEIRQLRKNMLDGKPSEECKNCYSREQGGTVSTRQWTTERWSEGHFDRVTNTREDGSISETTMPYLDLRFSNKCNLRCIMCSPSSSSSWRGDAIKLWNMTGEAIDKQVGARNVERTETEIVQMLDKSLDDLEEVYFAGGEPMMMQEHWETLKYLISVGRTDVIIRYSTNFTKFVYEGQHVFDLWKQFKKVVVSISLDGYGERGEYIRKGMKWDKMVTHVRQLQDLIKDNDHISYKFDCTINVFNAWHLPDLHKHLIDNNLGDERQLHIITLVSPDPFNMQILTPELKKECEERIRKHIAYLDGVQKASRDTDSLDFVIAKFENTIKYMNSADKYEERYDDFKDYVGRIDALRKQNYLEVCPELARLDKDE